MDLAARKRAWTGSVARPGDVAVLSNCEDDESRRWVVDAALGASGASGVVTRLAYAAAGLALDALPADGAAAPRRAALRRALRRHELYDRCAFAERAPYAARARTCPARGPLAGALRAATARSASPLALRAFLACDSPAELLEALARAGLVRALGAALEGVGPRSSVRLAALDAVPETVPPKTYAWLFPTLEGVSAGPAVDDGLDDLDVPDELASVRDRAVADRHLARAPELVADDAVDDDALAAWYGARARAMDAEAGAAAHAEHVCAIARDALGAAALALRPLHRDAWHLARLLHEGALRDELESLAAWETRSRRSKLEEAARFVERSGGGRHASEAAALRSLLGPFVSGKFALPPDDEGGDDSLLAAVADLALKAVDDRGDFGVALAACRASAHTIPVPERLAPSQTRLAVFVLDVAAKAFDGGNDVNVCGDLLACLTFDDHERLADDDAAFAEARGPGVWALVDDLRAKVDVCRALRGDLKLFLPLRRLRDAAPRLDDADLDALAAPSDDLGVVDVDGPVERFAALAVLKARVDGRSALAAVERLGAAGLWRARDASAALDAGRCAYVAKLALHGSDGGAVAAAVAGAADRAAGRLAAACAAAARERLRRGPLADAAAAADAALAAFGAAARARAAPPAPGTFDEGFGSFDATRPVSRSGDPAAAAAWAAAAATARGARRAARGLALAAAAAGADDGADFAAAAADGGAGGEEARAARVAGAVAAKILAAPSVADLGDDDTGRFLAALVDDEDADFLEDLEIFGDAGAGDGDVGGDALVVRAARLAAETTTGSGAVAAAAAARLALFRRAAADGDGAGAARHAARLARAAGRLDAGCRGDGAGDAAAVRCRDAVCDLAVDAATEALGAGFGGEALAVAAAQLPAGAKAMALFDAAGAFLGAPRPAGDAADRARDEILRAADAPDALERRARAGAALAYLAVERADAAFVERCGAMFDDAATALATRFAPAAAAAVVVAPDEALVAELVALGFVEDGARRACRATANADLDTALAWCVGHAGDADFAAPPPPAAPAPPDDAGDRRAVAGRVAAAYYGRVRATTGDPALAARCAAQLADLERKAGELDAASKLRAALLGAAAPAAPEPAAPPQPKEALARLFGGDEPTPASAFEGALSRLVAPEQPPPPPPPPPPARAPARDPALDVDVARFEAEPVYRSEALVRAAASGNGAAFEAAVAASRRYDDGASDARLRKASPASLARRHPGQEMGDSTSLQRECSARARSGKSIHASRALPEMIARPKLGRNEWKMTEIGAF